MPLFDRRLKGRQVDFPQGAFIDDDVNVGAIRFLVVADVMLRARPDPLRLHVPNDRGDQLAAQKGIFAGRVFEVASPEGSAVKIHARA